MELLTNPDWIFDNGTELLARNVLPPEVLSTLEKPLTYFLQKNETPMFVTDEQLEYFVQPYLESHDRAGWDAFCERFAADEEMRAGTILAWHMSEKGNHTNHPKIKSYPKVSLNVVDTTPMSECGRSLVKPFQPTDEGMDRTGHPMFLFTTGLLKKQFPDGLPVTRNSSWLFMVDHKNMSKYNATPLILELLQCFREEGFEPYIGGSPFTTAYAHSDHLGMELVFHHGKDRCHPQIIHEADFIFEISDPTVLSDPTFKCIKNRYGPSYDPKETAEECAAKLAKKIMGLDFHYHQYIHEFKYEALRNLFPDGICLQPHSILLFRAHASTFLGGASVQYATTRVLELLHEENIGSQYPTFPLDDSMYCLTNSIYETMTVRVLPPKLAVYPPFYDKADLVVDICVHCDGTFTSICVKNNTPAISVASN